MKTSISGRAFIEREEGCVLKAYKDSAGVLTIGYGHTDAGLMAGEVWSQGEADAALTEDLLSFERAVNEGCRIPPTQNQFDAMVSLAYNIGTQAFKDSTVLRKYNANNLHDAAEAFLMWRNAGGRPVLLPRRLREKTLFLS